MRLTEERVEALLKPIENEIYIFNQIWVGSYNIIGVGDSRERAIDEAWKAYRRFAERYDNYFNDNEKEEWLEYHGIDRESIEPINVNSGWVE